MWQSLLRQHDHIRPDGRVFVCAACKQSGSFDALTRTDCPLGERTFVEGLLAPVYPIRLVLTEEAREHYVLRHEVPLSMPSSRAPDFHGSVRRLTDMLTTEQGEGARRLGMLDPILREGDLFVMDSAYSTIDGSYIGDESTAKSLVRRGIAPQTIDSTRHTASIGFCEREQKWYGWSHRAIAGFGIGDVAQGGNSGVLSATPSSTSLVRAEEIDDTPPPDYLVPEGFACRTLDDCKTMAIAFALDVS